MLANPGRDYYTDRLKTLGCQVVTARAGTHTLNEGFAFSERAEELGWKSAIVIAQPFQLPRIMCTHLHVMRKRAYPMRVYAAGPRSVDYTKVTSGNQGAAGLRRFDQIEMEAERLPKYQAQGNLASLQELVEYMLTGRGCL